MLRSIAWLEFLFAGAQLFFVFWASQFLDTLFQIEIPLPTGVWVMAPALLFFVVFLCVAIEKSSTIEISLEVANMLVVNVKKLRTITIERKVDEIENIVIRPYRFSIEAGIVAGLQSLIGLGLLFRGYELVDVGAYTQGKPFLVYGIFTLVSLIAWLFISPKELFVKFQDNTIISLRLYIYSRKKAKKIRDFFFGRESSDARNAINVSWKEILFLGTLTGLFCVNYFTYAFTYQMVDSLSLLLLLAFLRRLWFHFNQPVQLLDLVINADGRSFLLKHTEINRATAIFPTHVRLKEWFLWCAMTYEIGWKFWYTMALIGINPGLWNPTIIFIILGYSLCTFTFSWRIFPSRQNKMPLLKWILFGMVSLLPLTAILSASGIWFFELSVLGIKVVY